MKLTAKLAYKQLKVNLLRTIWTLVGIVLSTSLITTVCSFVVSLNSVVLDIWGENYGEYKEAFSVLVLIPAAILSAVIVLMSIIVISNAFRVSAGQRTAQFGILKSVGATKKQISSTVMYESVWLSIVGIPIGIILGLIFAFIGIQVANYFLEELNSLIHLMIEEFTITIDFVIAWQALIAATLISFVTVLLSAWLPARKAAKIAAIESIRETGEIKIEEKQIHTNPLIGKLFGFEAVLATKNMKRNKRNFKSSIICLSIGIVLFISLASLSKQANSIENLIYSTTNSTVIVDYTSKRNYYLDEATDKYKADIIAPINSSLADTLAEKLRKYENTSLFGVGMNRDTYTAIVPSEMISSNMMETGFYAEELPKYEASIDIITVDSENYAELCKLADVPIGSNILLNTYNHNDNGKAVAFEPFLFAGQELELIKSDNSIHKVPLHGVLTQENMPIELFPNAISRTRLIVYLIVPEGDMRFYSWYAEPADIEGFMDYANALMAEMFPEGETSYMELGFDTRVYKIEDFAKVMNIGIILGLVFIYSFAILLTLIGLTSVISTMSTNVRMRSREFAMLQSVGMTSNGLKRMLNLESIICSAKSLIIGIPLAIVMTYLINLPIRSMYPIPYQIPWLAIVGCIVLAFVITWITMQYSASLLRDKNIVKTIQSESGM